MFKSFFPNPKWFLLSFLIYSAICIVIWYTFNVQIGEFIGLNLEPAKPVIGLGFFVTDDFILFYLYYLVCAALFSAFWFRMSPHPWQWWSIVGSAIILFTTYYSVQVSVAINHWRRPFGDLIQDAMGDTVSDTSEEIVSERSADEIASVTQGFWDLILIFSEIVFVFIVVIVLTRFFISHYIFRWRTAMNDYYTEQWSRLRHVEGASQRVQEDTMRFAAIMESLGASAIDAVMTLIAFLPVLWSLSEYVGELPIVGVIPYPLFTAVLIWSIFGTGLLATVGIKLPGLEFKNQRVEAAYRKELVYGEDDASRAQPPSLKELFANVRKNYFRIYFHYTYFNIARYMYLQADGIYVLIILIPTLAAGAITLGIYTQIQYAFSQVGNSFQILVHSWTQIIDLISVQKRLAAFEATLSNKPLAKIDQVAT